jgi:outer membrane murein-binding lipoprotein Lpp
MFRFLPVKPNIDTHYQSTLVAAALTGVLFLTGCQQQADTQPISDDSQTSEKTIEEDSQPMPQSDSAAARIEQFQPIYVAQAQGLQRRLQAEYESLQAADASDSEDSLLPNSPTDDANLNPNAATSSNSEVINETPSVENAGITNSEQVAAPNNTVATDSNVESDAEVDINTSTEVGERDLTVLKRISLEPRKPVMLTEEQIIERYQQTMEALYQPVTTPLSAEDSDTLINIATLVPQLFEHAEIAGRVSAKSPALARLIIQHQVWEQIEAQQVVDMQQMKQQQQQEFETLMTKFNDTIKGYDEQIAKYEQTLKEFQ